MYEFEFRSSDSLTVLREEEEDDDLGLALPDPPTIEIRSSKRDRSLGYPYGG